MKRDPASWDAVLPGLMLAAVISQAVHAQEGSGSRDDVRKATVGMRGFVKQVVLTGSELVPAPSSFKTPLVVRVLKTWPHGDHLRYDIEWQGLEEGSYNLVDYLVRKDGSSTEGLPAIEVEVEGLLPITELEPSDAEPKAAERVGGYSKLQVIGAIVWGVGLLAILFVGRKRKPRAAPPPPAKATLADRMRPLVEKIASGGGEESHKAELERLLLQFWRVRLDLGDRKAVEAIVAIKENEEAGALMRTVEQWLHAPRPPQDIDVNKLLEPYRSVSAADFEVRSSAEQSPAADGGRA
ncbi:MAG: hypothetical protein AB8H80_15750 [Planctomycetota bacterium]